MRSLQPNESTTVNISMDARQFIGSKTVRVFVTVGPKFISTATLTVSANARGDVAFSPTEIEFGNLSRGQTPTRPIDIEYTGSLVDSLKAAPVKILADQWNNYDIKADGDHYLITLNGKTILDDHDAKHTEGLIGLQCQPGNKIEFRSIKVISLQK